MCMHKEALSWTHSKHDVFENCQPWFTHNKFICTCAINATHSRCLSTAHMHNACTEPAESFPTRTRQKYTLWQKTSGITFCLENPYLCPNFRWGHTQDQFVPASQSFLCLGLSLSSFWTPLLHCLLYFADRNMTDIILLKCQFAVVETQQMPLYIICVTTVSGRLSHGLGHPPSPMKVPQRHRIWPCLTHIIAERGDEKQ